MKFKCLLLLAGSFLFIDWSPAISVPTPVGAQQNPQLLLAAGDLSQVCNARKAAVVTVYAGSEIGSGSIVSADGLVITNNHVVKQLTRSGSKKPLYVKLASGDRYQGQLLRTDPQRDLALIKLNAQTSFPIIPLANAAETASGQAVCAIGSPYGKAGVITQGKVSLIRRNGDLQSQVVLKPGNSGGPLLNTRGEMVGVNRAILESARGKNTGISIAIGIQTAKNFIQQSGFQVADNSIYRPPAPESTKPSIVNPVPRQQAGEIVIPVPTPEPSRSGNTQLGVRLDTRNLVVRQVVTGSPAAVGGLRAGDRLVAVNGNQLSGFDELQAFLERQPASAVFTVRRNQNLATVRISF
jgi:serine protease Do